MAHSFTSVTPVAPIPISRKTHHFHLPSPITFKVSACATVSDQVLEERHLQRRSAVVLGLAGPLLGVISFGEGNALAAARRPPPPPPVEKNDPNVSGVLKKVLASKKRKEAMKESMAKLREKGKPVQDQSE